MTDIFRKNYETICCASTRTASRAGGGGPELPETEAKRLAARNKYKALSQAAQAIGAMPADLAAAGVTVGGRR